MLGRIVKRGKHRKQQYHYIIPFVNDSAVSVGSICKSGDENGCGGTTKQGGISGKHITFDAASVESLLAGSPSRRP
jgi:hypothetical protein